MQLERGCGSAGQLAPSGTAGLALFFVNGYSRVPAPPTQDDANHALKGTPERHHGSMSRGSDACCKEEIPSFQCSDSNKEREKIAEERRPCRVSDVGSAGKRLYLARLWVQLQLQSARIDDGLDGGGPRASGGVTDGLPQRQLLAGQARRELAGARPQAHISERIHASATQRQAAVTNECHRPVTSRKLLLLPSTL